MPSRLWDWHFQAARGEDRICALSQDALAPMTAMISCDGPPLTIRSATIALQVAERRWLKLTGAGRTLTPAIHERVGIARMLEGQPVVFLACSEKFKQQVAFPVRAALLEQGVRGIIVSEEPLLPNTKSDPDSKVDAYLDSSEAVVALCTPDNELSDGTVESRQNIVLEIQRAMTRPGLKQRTQVLKAPGVHLPSDINPTYEELDVDNIDSTIYVIVKQLQAWGVLVRVPEPAPPPSSDPGVVDDLIQGIGLGEHNEAELRAYALMFNETRKTQRDVVGRVVRFLHEKEEDEDSRVLLVAGSLLEAINRLDPSLVAVDQIEQIANSTSFSNRATAAHLLWDRSTVAPEDVPLGLLGRLAIPAGEDWYVQAPAMAAVKQLLLFRPAARIIFDNLARSSNTDNRYAVAAALLDVASVDHRAVPRDLAKKLAGDADELVAKKATDVLTELSTKPKPQRDHVSPFGM